jgi:hypothetical protein
MKRAEMAGAIFEVLGGILSATEFRLKKSEDGFARKISGGKQVLGVPLWDYHPDFEFSLNICIRLDAVEATFHRFSGSPANYHRMSFTMIARLEQFTGGPPRYKVRSVEDAAYVGQLLSSDIRDKIVTFFRENETVTDLDRTVNIEHPGIDVTQNPSGAMHAIILARLAGNKGFEKLVSKHQAEMQLAPGAQHPFNHLVDYLRML